MPCASCCCESRAAIRPIAATPWSRPSTPRRRPAMSSWSMIEYPVMSGGNTISVVTVLLEMGLLPMQEPVTELTLEAPAGLIRVRAECAGGKVKAVTFRNVPAFAAHLDAEIDVPHLGRVRVDVGWGHVLCHRGRAPVRGAATDPRTRPGNSRVSSMIRQAAIEQLPVDHPGMGITISQLSGPSDDPRAEWKNAVTMASGDFSWDVPATWTGALDRCPCGTGTCAKMAVLHAKGELPLDRPFRHGGHPGQHLHRPPGRGNDPGGPRGRGPRGVGHKLDLRPEHHRAGPRRSLFRRLHPGRHLGMTRTPAARRGFFLVEERSGARRRI